MLISNHGGFYQKDMPPPRLNPNLNKLTRDIIMRTLRNHDATRPYLPSSPYFDEEAYRLGGPAESHLWGPRDYFKGEYYKAPKCHFASETGYHGCPSPKSLRQFLSPESMPQKDVFEMCENPEWLAHATCMETEILDNPYAYRLGLMIRQVERIFGHATPELENFAKQSQISQAEAVKYFIENFRNNKWRKTGILWWNIIDGWPQVSDAVVDCYGCKKLAYAYIKRSQQPLCMACKEPVNGKMELMALNDMQEEKTLEYTVENLTTGETVAKGKVSVPANGIAVAAELDEEKYAFFLIRWKSEEGEGVNHHTCSLGDVWEYSNYVECMKKAGFYDEFEGF
jgi:beta-mannosidase